MAQASGLGWRGGQLAAVELGRAGDVDTLTWGHCRGGTARFGVPEEDEHERSERDSLEFLNLRRQARQQGPYWPALIQQPAAGAGPPDPRSYLKFILGGAASLALSEGDLPACRRLCPERLCVGCT